MLIICNGSFKSGSTWLHAIILEVLKVNKMKLEDVPAKYTNNINSPTTIIESNLTDFLVNEDYKNYNYITKSHYHLNKTISKDYDSFIHFFFVERDIKDAIVSHFFHLSKKYRFISNFNIYYFLIGRLKAFEILEFNRRYVESFGSNNFFKYSVMKNDFDSVVLKISSILSLKQLSSDEIKNIKDNTSIKKMRSDLLLGKTKYYSTVTNDKENVIRKGVIGDWSNYFSLSQKKDIERLERMEVSILFRISYFLFFTLRRIVFRIE